MYFKTERDLRETPLQRPQKILLLFFLTTGYVIRSPCVCRLHKVYFVDKNIKKRKTMSSIKNRTL